MQQKRPWANAHDQADTPSSGSKTLPLLNRAGLSFGANRTTDIPLLRASAHGQATADVYGDYPDVNRGQVQAGLFFLALQPPDYMMGAEPTKATDVLRPWFFCWMLQCQTLPQWYGLLKLDDRRLLCYRRQKLQSCSRCRFERSGVWSRLASCHCQ